MSQSISCFHSLGVCMKFSAFTTRWRHSWSSELNPPIPVHLSSLIPKMSMFTLAISCLTTSNLPWFMDITLQVPRQYSSSQHQTLLPSAVTSITGCCFCLGSVSSFFLELFLHWSPVAYWAPTDLGSSCSSQGKNTEVICHSLLQWTTFLSELSTMTCTSWGALQWHDL